MSCEECRKTWASAEELKKAPELDAAFPNCACEECSLVDGLSAAISNEELLARVLTTPGGYSNDEILTQKLTSAAGPGLSVIRKGASDAEILDTISNLIDGQAIPQELLGAAVFSAEDLRTLGKPDRWFGVYHTPDAGKLHHADVLATTPSGSKNQQKVQSSQRRGLLRDMLMKSILFEGEAQALLRALRENGL